MRYSIQAELFLFAWGSDILGTCIETDEEGKSPNTCEGKSVAVVN